MDFEYGIVGEDLCENEYCVLNLPAQASELELQKVNEIESKSLRSTLACELQYSLQNLVSELQPRVTDHHARIDIINRLSSIAANTVDFKGAKLSTFGSFESNLYTQWADLDLSLELPSTVGIVHEMSKNMKTKILWSFLNDVIYKDKTKNVQFIQYARVPLITFDDACHNVSCDISIGNGMGILKSRLLRWISEIDPRCRDLIFLIKFWAKVHKINDPKSGTLNSFALSLLVIFHLQTRMPPILPPLSAILDEDISTQLSDPEIGREKILDCCWAKIQPYVLQKFGDENKSSVAELFISFFNQFSAVASLWRQGLVVCTFKGSWGDRMTTCAKWSSNYMMTVEDPFDRTDNCARSVQDATAATIFTAFKATADILCNPLPDNGLSELLSILFHWPTQTSHSLQPWLSTVYLQNVKTIWGETERSNQVQTRRRIQNPKPRRLRLGNKQKDGLHSGNKQKGLRSGSKQKDGFDELERFLQDQFEAEFQDKLQIVNTDSMKKTTRNDEKILLGTSKTDEYTQPRNIFPKSDQETLSKHFYWKGKEKASISRRKEVSFDNRKNSVEFSEQLQSDSSVNVGKSTALTIKEGDLTETKNAKQSHWMKPLSKANQVHHTISNTQNSSSTSSRKYFRPKNLSTSSNGLDSPVYQHGESSKGQLQSSYDSNLTDVKLGMLPGTSHNTVPCTTGPKTGAVQKSNTELSNATEAKKHKKAGKTRRRKTVHGPLGGNAKSMNG